MKSRILIVDDSALARRTLRQALEEMGHEVAEAADGASALEQIFLKPPDLVILDMVMHGMYGSEVLGKLRELKSTVPVIVATADIQTATAEEVRTAGAKAILNKPVNRQQLAGVVSTVLSGGDSWN